MLALGIGALLAVAGLAFVLWPIVRGTLIAPSAGTASDAAPEASAIEALREIQFDQATGKLSPEDYASLRASYTPLALAELRERDAATTAADLDPAEALVARVRERVVNAGSAKACPEHGVRPESDAMFCSDCGRFLGPACASCGAQVTGERARFCTECGASLAA